jgi:type II secretory pathway component GspD/PulD (secretin)
MHHSSFNPARVAFGHFVALMTIMFAVTIAGCCGMNHIERKTVQDLYHEAVANASSRPEVVQPCFPARELTTLPPPAQSVEVLPKPNFHSPPPLETRPSTSASELELLDDVQARSPHTKQPLSDNVAQSTRRSQPLLQKNASTATSEWNLIRIDEETENLTVVPASFVQSKEAGSISEIFEQTDIREALQILASSAGVSIVIDETVGGVTSAQIENATFEEALQKILLPIGLVYAKVDGTYMIAPPEPDSPLYSYVSERSQYAPNYHEVTRLTSLLPPRFKPYLHSSVERNLIVIDAPHEIGRDIHRRLSELDQPVPQVELEAIVCVVSPDCGFRFGLDWGHVVGIEGVESLKAGMTGLTFQGAASRQGMNNAFSDFAVTSAFVRLLAQEGYITIRAAPRVTARDGEKASISINREAFFSLQPASSNILFRQDVQKVDSGIVLEITPRVHGDMVAVNIGKAEVSEDIRASDSRSDLTSNPFPIINRRVVSTNVNVRDGHTIVIGGLVQSQTVDRINRVPGLSRIPLVGKLFQTIDKQKQDAEVAIFISPRIVPIQYCQPTATPQHAP